MANLSSPTPRRGFLGSIAAGAAALVAGKVSLARAEVISVVGGESLGLGDEWLARIKGKHRQLFDCMNPNEGLGAAFPLNFLDSFKETAMKVPETELCAVAVFRHMAMPLMVNDRMWAKYKLGEMLGVKDPKTGAPATRNIFRDNVPLRPGLTYEQIMATRPVIMTACNMALAVFSGMRASVANTTAEAAKKEWADNLLAGVVLVPSGVYAVNRAQQTGCTYCYAG
jgi:hypothetical protein